MENIIVYEADDFISEIFWGSTWEVRDPSPKYFQDEVSRKAHHYLKAFWAPADGYFWRFRQ